MPGPRRTAVATAAFLLVGLACATAQTPVHTLPAGTPVIFVTDTALDAGRHEGTAIPLHLRDPLILDGNVVAPAGTKAELRLGGSGPDGHRTVALFVERFMLSIGLMPVKSRQPLVPPIAEGATIEAQTQADIDHVGDRYSIRIPFPFKIPVDQPAAYYTPTPARTAPPRTVNPPRRSRSPEPGASPAPGGGSSAPLPATPAPSLTAFPTPFPTSSPTPFPSPH